MSDADDNDNSTDAKSDEPSPDNEAKPATSDDESVKSSAKSSETAKSSPKSSAAAKGAKSSAEKAVKSGAAPVLTTSRMVVGLAAVGLMLVLWRFVLSPNESGTTTTPSAEPSTTSSPAPSGSVTNATAPLPPGLSSPLAAGSLGNGDVLVAALDAQAKAIVVQRINSKDEVVAKGVALSEVTGSADSELKLIVENVGVGASVSADAGGAGGAGGAGNAGADVDGGSSAATRIGDAVVVWRGLRGGKLVRQFVVLNGADLKPKGEPAEALAAFCATRDAVWFSDGSKAHSRPWSSSAKAERVELPKEKDASLLCGQHRAFAVLEEDERTSVLPLGHPPPDAGPHAIGPVTMIRDNDFGEDEQRELSEYTVPKDSSDTDDVGFVRLAASGSLAIRELTAGNAAPSALKKLKSQIKKDDDVVAVEASAKFVVIVYTQDVSDTSDAEVCTKVGALRVDRTTLEESLLDLSSGRCGHEVGPFWTSTVGDTISIAWPERTSAVIGKPRAPIAALAHTLITPTNKPTLSHIEQSAEALSDAGCTSEGCFAAALIRSSPTDKGIAKIIRYK